MAYDKVIDSAVLDADLTEIADSIRSKTGSTEKFTLDQMAAEIAGIDTVHNQNKTITANGTYQADSGYTGLGTVTVAVPEEEPVLQDKQITANGTYQADAGYDGLGEVVVDVPSGAPVIQPLSVTANGTYEAPVGVDGYSPVTVAIESGGGGDDAVEKLISGSITEISSDTYSLREYSFYKCSSLTTVNFSNVIQIPSYCFGQCTKLTSVSIPSLRADIGTNAFYQAQRLQFIDLGLTNTINQNAFKFAYSLDAIVLRKTDGVCALSNINAFYDSKFYTDNTGGTVYVPQTLIESYQTATNWSTLYAAGTCNFVAIEGSEYE